MKTLQILFLHLLFWLVLSLSSFLKTMNLYCLHETVIDSGSIGHALGMIMIDVLNVIFFFYFGYLMLLRMVHRKLYLYIFVSIWVLYFIVNLLWLQNSSIEVKGNFFLFTMVGTLRALGWCACGILGRIFIDWLKLRKKCDC